MTDTVKKGNWRGGGRKPYHQAIPCGTRIHMLRVNSGPWKDPTDGRIRYNVNCDCGNVKAIIGYELRRGRIRACGCQRGGGQR
jgi:hypothetical protein